MSPTSMYLGLFLAFMSLAFMSGMMIAEDFGKADYSLTGFALKPKPAPSFHLECKNNACVKVAGAGTSQCRIEGMRCTSTVKAQPICGNGICETPKESLSTCPKDCKRGDEAIRSFCGNGLCDYGENYLKCPKDCKKGGEVVKSSCGNGICETPKESLSNCPKDCKRGDEAIRYGICGNGVCDYGENYLKCAKDCKRPK